MILGKTVPKKRGAPSRKHRIKSLEVRRGKRLARMLQDGDNWMPEKITWKMMEEIKRKYAQQTEDGINLTVKEAGDATQGVANERYKAYRLEGTDLKGDPEIQEFTGTLEHPPENIFKFEIETIDYDTIWNLFKPAPTETERQERPFGEDVMTGQSLTAREAMDRIDSVHEHIRPKINHGAGICSTDQLLKIAPEIKMDSDLYCAIEKDVLNADPKQAQRERRNVIPLPTIRQFHQNTRTISNVASYTGADQMEQTLAYFCPTERVMPVFVTFGGQLELDTVLDLDFASAETRPLAKESPIQFGFHLLGKISAEELKEELLEGLKVTEESKEKLLNHVGNPKENLSDIGTKNVDRETYDRLTGHLLMQRGEEGC